MMSHHLPRLLAFALLGLATLSTSHAELTAEQRQVPLEQVPADASKARVVLLAGTPSNKPGQHEYFAGCALLMDWLGKIPGVAPVMVADGWPKNESVLDGARCVVIYMDGGDKLAFLEPARLAKMQALADAGTGFVILHQAIDCPADQAATFKNWFGAAFQGDIGCRGHWDVNFESIATTHATARGITPFPLLKDGWLYNLHFAEKGVTPVLACAMPDNSRKTAHGKAHSGRAETVAWAYERPAGGRSFGFTGCDLHANWAEANQRKLLLNGILWSAGLDVAKDGFSSTTTDEDLKKNWDRKVFQKKEKATKAAAPAAK